MASSCFTHRPRKKEEEEEEDIKEQQQYEMFLLHFTQVLFPCSTTGFFGEIII